MLLSICKIMPSARRQHKFLTSSWNLVYSFTFWIALPRCSRLYWIKTVKVGILIMLKNQSFDRLYFHCDIGHFILFSFAPPISIYSEGFFLIMKEYYLLLNGFPTSTEMIRVFSLMSCIMFTDLHMLNQPCMHEMNAT